MFFVIKKMLFQFRKLLRNKVRQVKDIFQTPENIYKTLKLFKLSFCGFSENFSHIFSPSKLDKNLFSLFNKSFASFKHICLCNVQEILTIDGF